jgi:fumarate reductase subunit D
MPKSNKPIVWSLFAAGGTLAALLAPVLALLFLLAALGRPPELFDYATMHAFASHWLARLALFVVIALFLWHAAHRLRITLHDLGLRRDRWIAAVLYTAAAAGTLLAIVVLLRF